MVCTALIRVLTKQVGISHASTIPVNSYPVWPVPTKQMIYSPWFVRTRTRANESYCAYFTPKSKTLTSLAAPIAPIYPVATPPELALVAYMKQYCPGFKGVLKYTL